MVLVDSSHEEQTKRFAAVTPPPPAPPAATSAPTGGEQPDFEGMSVELSKAPWHASIPLVVLTRGRAAPVTAADPGAAARDAIWNDLQNDLATRSPKAEHIIARQSGHYIQNDEPQLVIDAVKRVVSGSR